MTEWIWLLVWLFTMVSGLLAYIDWHRIQALKVHCMSEGTANMRLQTESFKQISKSLKSMDETQAMIQACLSKLHASVVVALAHLFKTLVSIDETLTLDGEEREYKRVHRLADRMETQLRCPTCKSENIAVSSWGEHSCDECGAEWGEDGKVKEEETQ